MIAIAVVASLVAYAWVMGYMNFQTSQVGKSIQLPSYAEGDAGSNQMRVYVQNVGQGTVQLLPTGSIYVNDKGYPIVPAETVTINEGETKEIIVQLDFQWASGTEIKIKVVTTDGTFMETKGAGTSGSTGSTQYSIDVTVNPPSAGSVSADPSGPACTP